MSSLLVLTHFPPLADESRLPGDVQQYLNATPVRKYFIYEPLRIRNKRGGVECAHADYREHCLLAVRSPMLKTDEHTLARYSTAEFLQESGVGILWMSLEEDLQIDLPGCTSWEEASPRLKRCIVQNVRDVYRVDVSSGNGL